jgi:hypothetical protein
VKDASVSFEIPERTPPSVFQVMPEGSKDNQLVSIESIGVDENFGATFGLQLLEGRFSGVKSVDLYPARQSLMNLP